MKHGRWRLAALLTAVAMVGTSLAGSPSASAYTLIGCKYQGSDPTIRYFVRYLGPGFAAPFTDARDAWNSKSVPGVFTKTTNAGQSKLDVTRGTYAADWWGLTSGICSSGVWVEPVNMYFNDGQMFGLTPSQRTLVMEHELGHAYGLDHMPTGCSTPAVMVPGEWKWTCTWLGTPPWSDDQAGVKHVY